MMIEWRLDGIDNVYQAIRSLPERLQNKGLRPGIEAGCRIIAKTAKQYAPVESGALKATIGYTIKQKPGGNVKGIVGNKNEQSQYKGQTRNPAHYSHLVEKGHAGPHGPAQPHPFLRPAVDSSQGAVQSAIADKVSDAIERLGQ